MPAYEMKSRKVMSTMPGGVIGQISFRRLMDQLSVAGEFKNGEIVTHLEVDLDSGILRYRVTYKE